MKLVELMLITIHLTSVFCKKKHKELSSESIENILYYKDCNHKQLGTPAPERRAPPQPQQCKMCCSMCCGDQCADCRPPAARPPVPPGGAPARPKRNKQKFPSPSQPPLPGRRGLGFTRENIKSLISQDEDIRKILKDLVKVTMQKVDLVQMLNKRPAVGQVKPDRAAGASDFDNDL